MSKLSKHTIKNLSAYDHYLTVRELLKFIEEHNLDKNAKVCVQRIEDVYYEKHGWSTVKKKQDDSITEYTPVWGGIKYKDDDTLYLDLHY